jgi:Flp pilus assembly pilin Flp
MKPSQIILSLAVLATTTEALPVAHSISNRVEDVVRLDDGNTFLSYYSSNESRSITEVVVAPEPDVTALEYGLMAARDAVAQEEEPDATAIEYALLKTPIADPIIIVGKFFFLLNYFHLE